MAGRAELDQLHSWLLANPDKANTSEYQDIKAAHSKLYDQLDTSGEIGVGEKLGSVFTGGYRIPDPQTSVDNRARNTPAPADTSGEDMKKLGYWLKTNPDKQGTPEWNDISAAYQKIQTTFDQKRATEAPYRGLGGAARAAGEGAYSGLVSGLNDLAMGVEAPSETGRQSPQEIQQDIRKTGAKQVGDLPDNARSVFVGGSAFGNVLAGAPLGPALSARGMIGGLTSTLGPAAGAGFGAATGDYLTGGSPLGAVAGGVAGGTVSPGALTGKIISDPRGMAGKIENTLTKVPVVGPRMAGIVDNMIAAHKPEVGASFNLRGALRDNGYDVDALLASRAPNASTPETIAYQNQVLYDVAQQIAQHDPNFARVMKAQEDAYLGNAAGGVAHTIGGQDPQNLTQVAQDFAKTADTVAGQYEQTARTTARTFRPKAGDVMGSSSKIQPELERIKQDYRRTITDPLYAAVRDVPMPAETQALGDLLTNARANMRSFGAFDDHTKWIMGDLFTQAPNGQFVPRRAASSRELMALRQSMSRNAKALGAAAQPDGNAVSTAVMLKSKIGDLLKGGNTPGVSAEYRRADDAYAPMAQATAAGTWPGDLLRRSPGGGYNTRPGLAAQSTLEGGGNQPVSRVNDLLGAERLPTGRPGEMLSALKPEMARRIGSALDWDTGMIKPKSGQRMQGVDAELDFFPDLKKRLSQAMDEATLAAERRDMATQAQKEAGAFQRDMAQGPGSAIGRALGDKAGATKLNQIYDWAGATQTGREALKAAIREHILQANDPLDAVGRLVSKVDDQTVLADWMKQKGLLSTTEYAKIRAAAKEIQRTYEMRQSANARGYDPENSVPDVATIPGQIIGAKIGAWLGGGSGSSLQGAAIMSRQVKKMMTGGGRGYSKQRQVLADALLRRNGQSIEALLAPYSKPRGEWRYGDTPQTFYDKKPGSVPPWRGEAGLTKAMDTLAKTGGGGLAGSLPPSASLTALELSKQRASRKGGRRRVAPLY